MADAMRFSLQSPLRRDKPGRWRCELRKLFSGVPYQKITDIYATSIDYDANVEQTQLFFQTVQNKMHWAAHGHTAAEIVARRSDASRPNMGLTTWKNAPAGPVRKGELAVAKNYLTQEEIESLNLIVSAYLDFAALQARSHRPMHMADWISKLDDFIRLTLDPDTTAGAVAASPDVWAVSINERVRLAIYLATRKNELVG